MGTIIVQLRDAARKIRFECGVCPVVDRMTARDPLFLLLTAWAASAVLMVMLWLIERRLQNLSIADVGWCYGLALVLLWYAGSANSSHSGPLMAVSVIAGKSTGGLA